MNLLKNIIKLDLNLIIDRDLGSMGSLGTKSSRMGRLVEYLSDLG